MSDKISELNMSNAAPAASSTDVTTVVEGGFVQSFFRKIYNNKMYIFIAIAVFGIGLASYYFYMKKYGKNKASKQEQPALSSSEYYVLDNNGKPVKVSGNLHPLPIIVQQPSQQEIAMLQNQMLESNNQQKLEHPTIDSEQVDYNNDNMDNELERINSNENQNIRNHNLTASELNEIEKKLDMMNN